MPLSPFGPYAPHCFLSLRSQVIAALALGRFPLATRGGYFEVLKAITEDPVPALSPESFSKELCGFVELMLRRDPAERPNARTLLGHPFLMMHKGCHKLVGMVKVAPATGVEVCTVPLLLLPLLLPR